MEINGLTIKPFVYLRDANLRGTNLHGANLHGADLSDADLSDADLRGAMLRGADLRGANLMDCVGNGEELRSIQADRYYITWTDQVLQIGCERHPIDAWMEFTDREIIKMEGHNALTFWRRWKPILQQIITLQSGE